MQTKKTLFGKYLMISESERIKYAWYPFFGYIYQLQRKKRFWKTTFWDYAINYWNHSEEELINSLRFREIDKTKCVF